MAEVDEGLKAQAFGKGVRRNVGDLFRAKKSLIRTRAPGEIVEKPGDVLSARPRNSGRAAVVVPGATIQKLRGFEGID